MIDPLYRPRTELPGTGEVVDLAGVVCEVVVTDTAPDLIDAQWMDDREVTLTLPDGLDPVVFTPLLSGFAAYAVDRVDRSTTATFSLASRDVIRAKSARDAGFLPASMLAVADLRRPAPADGNRAEVRDAVRADAPAVAELWCEQAEYEAGVGTLRTSDLIRAAIRDKAAESIDGNSTVLVADRPEGGLAGAVVAETPSESEWAGTRLTVAPISYLSMASTAAAARSRGIGAGLVTELHRRHRAAGIAASVLHYSAFNPLSVPFWSQRGYRPVVTIYARSLRP